MGRSSYSGRSSFPSFRVPSFRSARSTPPKKEDRKAPPPAEKSSGESVTGSIGSSIADGFGFGTGNAIAHRAADAVLGPRTIQTIAAPSATAMTACSMQSDKFVDCLYGHAEDISKCQSYMDTLVQCKKNSGSTTQIL